MTSTISSQTFVASHGQVRAPLFTPPVDMVEPICAVVVVAVVVVVIVTVGVVVIKMAGVVLSVEAGDKVLSLETENRNRIYHI